MAKGRLVILSVSAGAGHVRAAEALCAAATEVAPGVEAIHVDVMDLAPRLFRKLYVDSYESVVRRHPSLWGYLYQKTDHSLEHSHRDKMRRAIETLNTKKLFRMLADAAPAAVICTHFLPSELISRRIATRRFDTPVWVTVTDFDVHQFWVHPHMDGYFAASEEVAWRMRARGIPADSIRVTGIPIMPAFSQDLDRAECAREIGLDPDKATIMFSAGGGGISSIAEPTERLLALRDDFQIIALAGRNHDLVATLEDLARRYPGRLHPSGYTTTIERLMAASDLIVTKPGGLTTSECLAMRLPMILVSPIPGQEERNADYLLENGAALKAYDTAGLEYRVNELLENPDRLAALRRACAKLRRPFAARRILETVLNRP